MGEYVRVFVELVWSKVETILLEGLVVFGFLLPLALLVAVVYAVAYAYLGARWLVQRLRRRP